MLQPYGKPLISTQCEDMFHVLPDIYYECDTQGLAKSFILLYCI